MDLVGPEIAGPMRPAAAIPFRQKRAVGATRLAPTHPVAHGRMTGRHRLTVKANLLPQASRHPGLRLGELDPRRPNPPPPTSDPPLPVDQRHRRPGPGQLVPGAIAHRSHATHAAPARTARIPAEAPPLNPDRQRTVRGAAGTLRRHDPKPRQP